MLNKIKKDMLKIENEIGKVESISYINDYHNVGNYDFFIYLSKNKNNGIKHLHSNLLKIITKHTSLSNLLIKEIELIERPINNLIKIRLSKFQETIF